MNIITIGGSAGALTALKEIIFELPESINAAIFIVIHFPEDKESFLTEILKKRAELNIVHAVNNCSIEKGNVYIAPPGFHLIIKKGKLLLSNGPKENRFRPSIDVLFRSASLAYGSLVTGVILSGALDDGVAGLSAIKKSGGVAVVQDPEDAIMDGLPLNAIKDVEPDYCMPAAEIASVLQSVANKKEKTKIMKKDELLEWESSFAEGQTFDMGEIKKHSDATRYICPLCEGPLFKLHDKKMDRYRCFVGHAFSAETLLNLTNEKIEHLLWTTYRTMDEKKEMLSNMITDKSAYEKEEQKITHQLSILKSILEANEHHKNQ